MFFEYLDWRQSTVERSISVLNDLIRLPYEYVDGIVRIDGRFCPDTDAPVSVCFPKLGPKSWRDTGSGKPVLADAGLKARLVRLLGNISDQQGYLVREIAKAGQPLFLYLFDWVDYSQISEFRVTVKQDDIRLSSSCIRCGVGNGYRADVLEFAKEIAADCGCDDMIVDVAYLPSGECKLVEINPPNRQVSLQGASSYVRLKHV